MAVSSNGRDEVLLDVRAVSKSFAAIRALDSVSLEIRRGEVLALVGANGAGKSTLIRVLAGAERPDSGAIIFADVAVPPGDPKAARDCGLAFIYQDPMLVRTMTVADNLVLGHEVIGRFGVLASVRDSEIAEGARRILGDEVSLGARVSDLSRVQQQLVAIARAVSDRAQLFVMDEPTAALSQIEVTKLFTVIRELIHSGSSVLFVSHRLEEVQEIADRLAVLRDGRLVFLGHQADVSTRELVRLIVGSKAEVVVPAHATVTSEAETLLEVSHLTQSGRFEDVSFAVRRGEIVALVGLVGSGQIEVTRAIAGANRATSGVVSYPNGEAGLADSPADGLRRGVSLLPQSRTQEGTFPGMSVRDNLLMGAWCSPVSGSHDRSALWNSAAAETIRRLGVYPESCQSYPIRQLSGGNQQKIMLGRAMLSAAPILLLEEPTAGVDVGSKPQLLSLVASIADDGRGAIVASSDPDEVLAIADRVLVLRRGRIIAERRASESSKEEVLGLCLGTRAPASSGSRRDGVRSGREVARGDATS